jgi:putative aldouronate transport system substrate-binding protein
MKSKLIKRKVFIALMCVLLFLSACTAPKGDLSEESASSSTKMEEQEFVTLRGLYSGSESVRMKEFLENEFKDKMKAELNIGMELIWIPWDMWLSKRDMMLSAGEQIDWLWGSNVAVSRLMKMNAIISVDEYLHDFGQDLTRVIPEENFDAFKFDGKIMAIPTSYSPTSNAFRSVLVRQDILEEVGMDEIKSISDIEKFILAAKDKYPDMKPITENLVSVLMREYDPEISISGSITDAPIIAFDENSNKVISLYENEAWKMACRKMGEWTEKGYIMEDVTIKPKESSFAMDEGLGLMAVGAISGPLEWNIYIQEVVPDGRYEEHLLNPDGGKYRVVASGCLVFITSLSKYPERVVQFLNWIYKSTDNYNFAIYGIEGKDYVFENDRIKLLTTDTFFYEWMFRNLNIMSFPTNVDDSFIKNFKNWDNDAQLSCSYGFVFDMTPVKTEDSQLRALYNEKFLPLETGYVDFESNYPKALEALKAAGIDAYVAEYQKQLDEYLASKK